MSWESAKRLLHRTINFGFIRQPVCFMLSFMRNAVLFFSLTCALAAQPTPAGNAGAVAPTPAADVLPPLVIPSLTTEKPAPLPMSLLDAEAFLPKDAGLNAAHFPRPDSRTPAQLAAMLSAYVGTWRGEAVTCFFYGPPTERYPIELVYKLEQEKGVTVLVCDGTYHLPSGAQTMRERAWVEKGRIVAELEQGRRKQSFAANTRGGSLVWYSTDSASALLDFCQTETLRLTVDGGQLHEDGFDVEYGPSGQTLMTGQTMDLKLVKK